MKLYKLALLFGALSFTACDDGSKTETDPDTDTDATSDTDTDSMMETGDSGMMACYDDGLDGPPEWDLCEYDNGWEDAWTVDCSANTATLILRTNNWGWGASLYIADTRYTVDYDEEHTMTESDSSSETGGYSLFEVDLATNTAFADQDDGLSVFVCDNLDPTSGTFQATMAAVVYTDQGQQTVADCVVFGENPDELISGTVVGGSGEAASLVIPSWLDATNCVNIN